VDKSFVDAHTVGFDKLAQTVAGYLAAQHAELAWVVLLQAAKAKRDAELIEVVTRCHEEAETCGKWLRTRIKEAAPQVYAAG
jgi:hypothetical protein